MIPSEWRKSIVVPIPKKQNRGPCRVDEFRGISLVAVPYKALCSIVHKRMLEVVEGRVWWQKSREVLEEAEAAGIRFSR